MPSPTVSAAQGRLRGTSVAHDVWSFLGIPYAAPPIGPLRWRPPQPPSPWLGVRNATSFGPDPVQPVGARTTRAPVRSEDCLYLNIWAPKQQREGGWPVLVWSCGGAFTTGSGAFVEEDPARLAARGAVVVSFNIRLGLLGFLAHPGLSAESPQGSSGNYGLLDQAAAFRWVRENIAAFNGDSKCITFFGESAGATTGMLLLASPIAEKPFDRAIFQSPGSFGPLLGLRDAERHGATLDHSIEALRALPLDALLERAKQLPPVPPSLWLARPLRPIVDGWLLTSHHPFAEGAFNAVPAIVGTNEDEGRFFGPRMGVTSIEEYHQFVRASFGDHAEEALARYPVTAEADVPAMFSALFGDRAFTYPVNLLTDAFALKESDIYRYVYSYRHGGTRLPPTHADEIGIVMDNLPHVTSQDAEMADAMARYWLAFAETGDPNTPGLPTWPRYEGVGQRYLTLDLPPSPGARWRSGQSAFMAEKATS